MRKFTLANRRTCDPTFGKTTSPDFDLISQNSVNPFGGLGSNLKKVLNLFSLKEISHFFHIEGQIPTTAKRSDLNFPFSESIKTGTLLSAFCSCFAL